MRGLLVGGIFGKGTGLRPACRAVVALAALVAPALGTSACATYGSVADIYRGKGMHELAALYYGAQHLENPEDAAATAALSASVEAASRRLDQDIDMQLSAQQFAQALGADLRKEDILRYGRVLGAAQYDAAALEAGTAKLRQQAAAAAVARVDALATSDAAPEQQLAALRVAQAYSPDDGELAGRYERVRQRLTVNLVVRSGCGPGLAAATCRLFVDRLLAAMLHGNSELVQVVPAGSPAANADLFVSLDADFGDTAWQRVQTGRAEGQVERKNRFNELERVNGRTVLDKVVANYAVYERTARAAVRTQLRVQDATPAHKLLFAASPAKELKDTRKYMDWQGDERALPDLQRVGTDQTAPADPQVMSLQLAQELAEAAAKDLLHQLDGRV